MLRKDLHKDVTQDTDRKPNRGNDVLGFVGGLFCVGLSYIDAGWSVFWLFAGVILILWSAGSFVWFRKGG